jgi:hypothetical protein
MTDESLVTHAHSGVITHVMTRDGSRMSNLSAMADEILYRRKLAHGPEVRIRRTSAKGTTPVVAVLDVDRRAGTPREREGGAPPPLKQAQGASEAEVLASLKTDADDDRAIAVLMRAKGQR